MTVPPSGAASGVVVADGFALGWWDGSAWRGASGEFDVLVDDIPFEGGSLYDFVDFEDGAVTGRVGAEIEECIETRSLVDVPEGAGRMVGMPAGQLRRPRPIETISAAAEHQKTIETRLVGMGLTDPVVEITRTTRVDLDGDGRDEVLIEAERLSNQDLLGEQEGDYSIVVVRFVTEDDRVFDDLIQGDVVTADEVDGDFGGFISTSAIVGLVDVDGDGAFEIITRSRYYEGESVALRTYDEGRMKIEMHQGCGA